MKSSWQWKKSSQQATRNRDNFPKRKNCKRETPTRKSPVNQRYPQETSTTLDLHWSQGVFRQLSRVTCSHKNFYFFIIPSSQLKHAKGRGGTWRKNREEANLYSPQCVLPPSRERFQNMTQNTASEFIQLNILLSELRLLCELNLVYRKQKRGLG